MKKLLNALALVTVTAYASHKITLKVVSIGLADALTPDEAIELKNKLNALTKNKK